MLGDFIMNTVIGCLIGGVLGYVLGYSGIDLSPFIKHLEERNEIEREKMAIEQEKRMLVYLKEAEQKEIRVKKWRKQNKINDRI